LFLSDHQVHVGPLLVRIAPDVVSNMQCVRICLDFIGQIQAHEVALVDVQPDGRFTRGTARIAELGRGTVLAAVGGGLENDIDPVVNPKYGLLRLPACDVESPLRVSRLGTVVEPLAVKYQSHCNRSCKNRVSLEYKKRKIFQRRPRIVGYTHRRSSPCRR
jgi:hypothetical protein